MEYYGMKKWSDMTPLEWREFVNHEVCVTACDAQRFEGSVFTVDPVSASVVLVSPQGSVRVVLGHAVSEVQILGSVSLETEALMKSWILPHTTPALGPEELHSRRQNLRLWLQRNRFPVTEHQQELRVAGVLTISAPYRPEDCSCTNEIILARVQSLVQNTPTSSPDVDT